MIALKKIEGFNYEKFTDYSQIASYITNTNCQVHELGLSSNGDMIYGLSYGDLSKPMIFIDGTVHGGHEWRCTHWVKEFIERIANPIDDINKPLIEELTSKFCFFAIPCVNTYGYINDSYVNANGVNLNRNFAYGWESYQTTVPFDTQYKGATPFSEPESQIIKNVIDTYKVLGHLNCHTWGGKYNWIFETPSSCKEEFQVMEDIRESLHYSIVGFPLTLSIRQTPEVPWVSEWVGTQDNKSGSKVISMVFETGSEETDFMKAELGMTGLFIFSVYLLKRFENNIHFVDMDNF